MSECNSQEVIGQLETIVLLKNLRKQVESGKTSVLDVSAINAEIENQRAKMEETISQCGSMEGIPEAAINELAGEEEIKPLDIEASIEPAELPEIKEEEL